MAIRLYLVRRIPENCNRNMPIAKRKTCINKGTRKRKGSAARKPNSNSSLLDGIRFDPFRNNNHISNVTKKNTNAAGASFTLNSA